MNQNQLDPAPLLDRLRELHLAVRTRLHAYIGEQSRRNALDEMAEVAVIQGGDTIYQLDIHAEEILVPFCEAWGRETPFLLVAEGLPHVEGLEEGEHLFGCDRIEDARFILICDPIDGTRPLMYDKRSAWMLTGIAPNFGRETNMTHIEVAVQSELPTSRALYADTLWAVRGEGAHATTENLVTGEIREWTPHPTRSTTVAGGFAMFCKFFTGSKGWLANLEERLIDEVLGEPKDGLPPTFDDQYISNGGQLYDMLTGRDRFNAELRPLAYRKTNSLTTLCSHPYDLCCELIARECGVIVTDENGQNLSAPLNVTYPMTWIAYANEAIRAEIEPTLLRLINE
jgi:hypothetical protein